MAYLLLFFLDQNEKKLAFLWEHFGLKYKIYFGQGFKKTNRTLQPQVVLKLP